MDLVDFVEQIEKISLKVMLFSWQFDGFEKEKRCDIS
jgi:hypothetical protein